MPDDSQVVLRIAGREEPDGATPAQAAAPDSVPFDRGAQVKHSVRIDAKRGDGTAPEIRARPDDVVELAMDDGARIFLRADEAELRLKGAGKRSVIRPGVVDVAPALPLADVLARGGVGAWAIERLRTWGVDLPEQGARFVGERADAHIVPTPGLFHWRDDEGLKAATVEPELDGAGPFLVFLHGTASSTLGSFGALSKDKATWDRLQRRYPGRVLGLQHRTLLQSPIGNALDLMKRLPEGARLHLVSHSRGGLIGELLTRSQRSLDPGDGAHPFDDRDLALLRQPGHEKQLADLGHLNATLRDKRPVIERFVRVACPARGTTLASARLDHWLNMFLNVLGLGATAFGSPVLGDVYDALEAFLLAVVKERTDPRTIPGLEAMIPGSPLMKMLNRLDIKTDADLSVVEGDAEPSGVLRRLGIWFTDFYYGEDHDLVVNTSSMRGGVVRQHARWFLSQDRTTDHFSYFKNPHTADRVVAGLLRGNADLAGYNDVALDAAMPAMPALQSRSGSDVRPVVFVLPGMFGSHLDDNAGERLWVNPSKLAKDGIGRLAIGQPGIRARELVALYYAELCRHLDQTHEVRPWPYDWRQPIDVLGKDFAAALAAAFQETTRPIRIVAHSMGGLVARAALLDTKVSNSFRDRDACRLVELGTPSGGTFDMPMLLLGRNRLAGALAAIDMVEDARSQAEVIARFPGVLHLMPDGGAMDLFDAGTWSRLASVDPDAPSWPVPDKKALEAAKAFRAKLAGFKPDPQRMFYIAGQGATVDGVVIDRAAGPGERLVFTRSNEGDGQVLWRTGIPAGVRAWYSAAEHADLVRGSANLEAIEDLLRTGTTTLLSEAPAALTRGNATSPPIFRDVLRIQPAAEHLAHAALGGRPRPMAPAVSKIRIRVVHGHLAFAKHPVMLGHYTGDAIAGTEAQLEHLLSPLLSDRRRLGLYAGPIASQTIVMDDKSRPRGAVIVGLGDAGNLSIGNLQRTLRQGLLAYMAAESDRRRAAGAMPPAAAATVAHGRVGISSLLIGSYETGIDRSSCVMALLRAAKDAQAALDQCKGTKVQLHEIELIELIEDQALDIWHIISELLAPGLELAGSFELDGQVERMHGARRRLGGVRDPSWWQPIQITMPENAGGERELVFTVAGSRARAESRVIAADLGVVEPLMRQAIGGGFSSTAASPGRALFELLWPLALKDQSTDDRNRRLLLDEHSARLPWELLDDRRPWVNDGRPTESLQREPQAIRSGLLRQLLQIRFREQVAMPSGKRKALVIGDPRGAPMDNFVELPDAQKEAKEVAKLLEKTHAVTAMIGSGVLPQDVVKQLFAEAWDIIHIAAHGVVREMMAGPDGVKRPVTGVVLGQGVVLGPSTLAKLPVSPSLFFVNCCHLGKVDAEAEAAVRLASASGRRPELAASVAVELIRNGVGAVVAAGWAVDDDAAEEFATTFYGAMTQGQTFGTATLKARQAAYNMRPGGNTWGAYQCYGEPDFRLPGHSDKLEQAITKRRLATRAEAIAEAERIREDVSVGLERDLVSQWRSLDALEQREEVAGWLGSGELRVALAEARAEFDDLKGAIRHYEEARKGADTLFKIRAIEQLASLSARFALQSFRTKPDSARDRPAAIREIEEARKLVASLADALGPTQERWALQGAAWKRLAQVQEGNAVDEALRRMEDAYAAAEALGGDGRFYPTLMRCSARIALRYRSGADEPADVRLSIENLASAAVADEADFWQRTRAPDARVLLAVLDGEMSRDQEADIFQQYDAAWRHLWSPRRMKSVIEQFEFLEDVLAGAASAKPVITSVERIREKLEARIKAGSAS